MKVYKSIAFASLIIGIVYAVIIAIPIEKAEKSLMKFGEEGVKRFQQWERMFE